MDTAEFSKICWHIEYNKTSFFRILTSLAQIPSPPLALFVVTLPEAHWTSHSRMSGSRWVTTLLKLFQSLRPFLYSSSVYSCYLLLISSTSVRSIPFLSFIVPIFAWNVLLVSLIFLMRSLVFSMLLFHLFLCIIHLRRLSYISLIVSGAPHLIGHIFSFLLCHLFLFFSQVFVGFLRQPLCLIAFLFLRDVLLTTTCTMLQTSIHSSSGTLSTRSNPLNLLSPPLCNHKGFDLGPPWLAY